MTSFRINLLYMRSHLQLQLKRVFTGMLWLLALAILVPASAESYRVVRVFDGDSMVLRDSSGQTLQVRIAGIDAPEKGQPFADPARDHLIALLQSQPLDVKILKKDIYNRWLANIYVQDQDIGLIMLNEGFVWFFRRYQSDLSRDQRRAYDAAERKARQLEKGLWSDPQPTAPWDFRRAKREARAASKP